MQFSVLEYELAKNILTVYVYCTMQLRSILQRLFSFRFPGESVFARCLSALKDERVTASSQLKGPATSEYAGDKQEFIEHIRQVNTHYYHLSLSSSSYLSFSVKSYFGESDNFDIK